MVLLWFRPALDEAPGGFLSAGVWGLSQTRPARAKAEAVMR